MDQKILQLARELAVSEIDKFGSPFLPLFEFSAQKAIELAKILGADEDIVLLGSYLADLKLGEAIAADKIQEHVAMSAAAAKNFLDGFVLDQAIKDKIINCVEAHHGQVQFICKEAEIVCNADCYRFLHPKCILGYLSSIGGENFDLEKNLAHLSEKMDEKYNLLSLDICKQELEEFYQMFKKIIKTARFNN